MGYWDMHKVVLCHCVCVTQSLCKAKIMHQKIQKIVYTTRKKDNLAKFQRPTWVTAASNNASQRTQTVTVA